MDCNQGVTLNNHVGYLAFLGLSFGGLSESPMFLISKLDSLWFFLCKSTGQGRHHPTYIAYGSHTRGRNSGHLHLYSIEPSAGEDPILILKALPEFLLLLPDILEVSIRSEPLWCNQVSWNISLPNSKTWENPVSIQYSPNYSTDFHLPIISSNDNSLTQSYPFKPWVLCAL